MAPPGSERAKLKNFVKGIQPSADQEDSKASQPKPSTMDDVQAPLSNTNSSHVAGLQLAARPKIESSVANAPTLS